MTNFYKFGFLFLLWFLLIGCSLAQEKPNIILIVADDLGWGDVGFNGQKKINTPNIDKLAEEGIIFNDFYAGSTVCGPSRASLMTGKHTGHSTVRGNPRWTSTGKPVDINDDEITIAEELKRAGYATGVVGKWALAENLDQAKPNNQGFDYFYGFNKHLPAHHYYPDSVWVNNEKIRIEGNDWASKKEHYIQDLFTEKAKDYIADNYEHPFFLYLAYTTPHYELTVPEESKVQYENKNWPLRKMKPGHYLHDENGHVTYAAMVSRMDQQIGEIMGKLKEYGIDETTLVIFTSDNGHEYDNLNNEFFDSNGPYRGRKRDLYEGGVRTPFVAKWPGHILAGDTSNHLAAFWDVLPTLCEVAGVDVLAKTDGISFLPSLENKESIQAEHEYLYWEFNESQGPIQAIRKGKWKIIKRYNQGYELYDLDIDEGETNNVAKEFPDTTLQLGVLFTEAHIDNAAFPLKKLNPSRKSKKNKRNKE